MGGDVAAGIDDGHLTSRRTRVLVQQARERRARVEPLLQQVERPGPVRDLGVRLRRHSSDARLCPRDDRADREPVRLNRDPELSC